MKKPFLNALGAISYIVILVVVVNTFTSALQEQDETILIPMTMLGLFVLSAAVMGYFFLSEPLTLLVENKKKEAVIFFMKIAGFFACFVALFGISLLLI